VWEGRSRETPPYPDLRSHPADVREHRRAARCRDQDQGFYGRLPLSGFVLVRRELGYVIAGIPKSDEVGDPEATVSNRRTAVSSPLLYARRCAATQEREIAPYVWVHPGR
jgi:hypothetical protein